MEQLDKHRHIVERQDCGNPKAQYNKEQCIRWQEAILPYWTRNESSVLPDLFYGWLFISKPKICQDYVLPLET